MALLHINNLDQGKNLQKLQRNSGERELTVIEKVRNFTLCS